jgi:HJR/Mrr/RecB family endonuclease
LAAALEQYQCSKGIVVSNNYFTEAVLESAKENKIDLWDRDILKKKIEEIYT